jgi:hypothetical protein
MVSRVSSIMINGAAGGASVVPNALSFIAVVPLTSNSLMPGALSGTALSPDSRVSHIVISRVSRSGYHWNITLSSFWIKMWVTFSDAINRRILAGSKDPVPHGITALE